MDFSGLWIVVVGDVMLDRYLYGHVSRISPEAPVPILELEAEENRLGGAANVALNLRSLGVRTSLCGIVGQDPASELLVSQAEQAGIDTYGLVMDPERPTTTKIRLIAQKHHLLRVDREKRAPLPPPLAETLLLKVRTLLTQRPHALILEDYDKGALSPSLIRALIETAQSQDIPTLVDPKKEHFWAYEGATIFKPNLRELSEALHRPLQGASFAELEEAILELRRRMPHTYTVLTLSERGILAYGEAEGFVHVPAHYRNIVDVSGAGDTVVSVLAVGSALKLPLPKAVALANLAGGLVCEYVGVVPVPRDRWLEQAYALGLLEKSQELG